MYSSARDMAVFLAANLGEWPVDGSHCGRRWRWRSEASDHRPAQSASAGVGDHLQARPVIVEKYGGLNNASAYIGMMPSRKLGIVILGNRGNLYPNEVGRRILIEIAGSERVEHDGRLRNLHVMNDRECDALPGDARLQVVRVLSIERGRT